MSKKISYLGEGSDSDSYSVSIELGESESERRLKLREAMDKRSPLSEPGIRFHRALEIRHRPIRDY